MTTISAVAAPTAIIGPRMFLWAVDNGATTDLCGDRRRTVLSLLPPATRPANRVSTRVGTTSGDGPRIVDSAAGSAFEKVMAACVLSLVQFAARETLVKYPFRIMSRIR